MQYVIAPGFSGPQQELAIELMRLDLIAILIFSISGLVMAGLQANQHFLLPAMAPAFYNIGQIFGVAILAPQVGYSFGPVSLPGFGLEIHGLVYGVILGSLLHLGIQIPGLLRFGFHWIPAIDFYHPGMIKLMRLVGPRVLTMFFLQLFFIYRDHLASHMEVGAVTALNYGWFFMQVPETLIGSAIAIALLPTLSEQIAREDRAAFQQTVNRAVRVLLTLTIPVAALLIVGIRPLVQTLLRFDPAGVEMVVWATRGLSPGSDGTFLVGSGGPLLLCPTGCAHAVICGSNQRAGLYRLCHLPVWAARAYRYRACKYPGFHRVKPSCCSSCSTGASRAFGTWAVLCPGSARSGFRRSSAGIRADDLLAPAALPLDRGGIGVWGSGYCPFGLAGDEIPGPVVRG
jgi:hypothetical protein